jgi:WhiB family redox-sensing transcriptional regulator
MPIELFFTETKGPVPRTGKEACEQCPVTIECAIYALEHNLKDGIWGGMNVRQRRKVGLAELRHQKGQQG